MFLQERYGHYNLTDPFLALQRDFECGVPGGDKERRAMGSSPISVLEAVMAHCRKMQERMSAQLAAAESRQKRVRTFIVHLHNLKLLGTAAACSWSCTCGAASSFLVRRFCSGRLIVRWASMRSVLGFIMWP